jgi:hypothetical protein
MVANAIKNSGLSHRIIRKWNEGTHRHLQGWNLLLVPGQIRFLLRQCESITCDWHWIFTNVVHLLSQAYCNAVDIFCWFKRQGGLCNPLWHRARVILQSMLAQTYRFKLAPGRCRLGIPIWKPIKLRSFMILLDRFRSLTPTDYDFCLPYPSFHYLFIIVPLNTLVTFRVSVGKLIHKQTFKFADSRTA